MTIYRPAAVKRLSMVSIFRLTVVLDIMIIAMKDILYKKVSPEF